VQIFTVFANASAGKSNQFIRVGGCLPPLKWSVSEYRRKPCVELVILVLLVSLVNGKDCDSEWVNE